MKRPSKDEYYLLIAEAVSLRSTCLIGKFGAVIVKNDIITGTGYTGAARGVENCCDRGICRREEDGKERVPGDYRNCVSIHSEENAIINAGRERCIGGTIYIGCSYLKPSEENGSVKRNGFPGIFPCRRCMRLIINAGILWLVVRNEKGDIKRYNIIPNI